MCSSDLQSTVHLCAIQHLGCCFLLEPLQDFDFVVLPGAVLEVFETGIRPLDFLGVHRLVRCFFDPVEVTILSRFGLNPVRASQNVPPRNMKKMFSWL